MKWFVLIAVLVIGGYFLFGRANTESMTDTADTSTSPATTSDIALPSPTGTVTVPLAEQNDLGQSGMATFSENVAGNVVVTLRMTGGTFTDPQPAHIHLGACPAPGAVKYPLSNVVDGISETVLDTTWAAIEAAGEKLAVNVHKSAAEQKVYTACGDLPIGVSDGATGSSTAPAGSAY